MLTRKEQEKEQVSRIKSLGLIRLICHDLHVPGTTTCLLVQPKGGKVLARGLAIKSPEDQQNSREGRVKATARALRAFTKEKSSGPIHTNRYEGTEEHDRYLSLHNLYYCKAHYSPRPTTREQKALRNFIEAFTSGKARKVLDG